MCRALPARVVRVEGEIAWVTPATDHTATPTPVLLAGIDDVAVGDCIFHHAGLALSRLEPEEVDLILEVWDELLALDDAESPALEDQHELKGAMP
jgi:hydrogenase maturation factor